VRKKLAKVINFRSVFGVKKMRKIFQLPEDYLNNSAISRLLNKNLFALEIGFGLFAKLIFFKRVEISTLLAFNVICN
jgi:hypothetical protein